MTQSNHPQTTQQSPKSNSRGATGPLVVSESNPRYFTTSSGKETNREAIYLTGSHIWNNFHDGMGPGADCAETPEQFDYDAYLEFLNVEGHPFHTANNVNEIAITSIRDYQVLPLDPRVQALQEAYIRKVVDTVHDLPNVLWEVANESSGGGPVDRTFAEALGLGDPPEWGDSTEWQYGVIEVVKRHEQEQGYDKHPIGMTMQFPVSEQTKVNEVLFNSPADWISPGYDNEIFTEGRHPMAPGAPASRWFDDPPAGDGTKVVITDTDHYAPGKGDALWAWKSFLRGHRPILMDFGIIAGVKALDPSSGGPGIPPYETYEPARYAMGDTLRYACRMNLLAMEPRGNLSSTGYVLANPDQEYLVLQPSEITDPFTVRLGVGAYIVEWFSVNRRETKEAGKVTVEIEGSTSFTAPFTEPGPAALYLKRVGR